MARNFDERRESQGKVRESVKTRKVREKSGNFVVRNSFSPTLSILIFEIFLEELTPDPPKHIHT